MPLILCGFHSVGKTTIGRACAQRLSLPFFDIDLLLESLVGCSIRELWKSLGEKKFRELEAKFITNLKNEPSVIALGGGSLLSEQNIQHLMKLKGTLVYLQASLPSLLKKIEQKGFPPFMPHPSEVEKVAKIRFPIFEKAAHYIINTDEKTEAILVEEVCALYA